MGGVEIYFPWLNLAALISGILLLVGSSVLMDEFIALHDICLQQPKTAKVSCVEWQLLVTAACFGFIGGIVQVLSFVPGHLKKWEFWLIAHIVLLITSIFAFGFAVGSETFRYLGAGGRPQACLITEATLSTEHTRKVEFFVAWTVIDGIFAAGGGGAVYFLKIRKGY